MITEPIPEFDFPEDRHYDGDNHMWVKFEPTTHRVYCGIDALGLEALGDMAYISLQVTGGPVERGESIGTLEAAKMTAAVIAPVSGTLVARNEPAMRDPLLVNQDPYGQGWLVAIEPGDWQKEAATLVHGPAIVAWVEAEIDRYRRQGWID